MKRTLYVAIAALLLGVGIVEIPSAPAVESTPSPSASPSSSPAPNVPTTTLVPNYRDPEIPQIQSLITSANKVGDIFTISADLGVKIRSNTLNSIEINFLPRVTALNSNSKLMPPCVKLGSLKSTSTRVGADMPSLQTRVASGGSYLEHHVVTFTAKMPPVLYATDAPTYQDICDGQYVISTIILKDAASHTLTITANASSTAGASTSNSSNNSNTATAKSKYTDASIMQTDFWTESLAMPCSPSSNLAPTLITSTVGGKTVQTLGTPASSPTIRSTCNQNLDFGKVYFAVDGTTANQTSMSGTSSLPVVDYVSQTKTALSENSRMKNQIEILNKQVASLQNSVNILRRGGKLPADTPTLSPTADSDTAGAIVDYKALADSLQKQLTALKKLLPSTASKSKAPTSKASPSKAPTSKASPSSKAKVAPKITSAPAPGRPSATSSSRRGGSGWNRPTARSTSRATSTTSR